MLRKSTVLWYWKIGSPRTSQKFDLFQIWTLITFWLGWFGKPTRDCKQEGFSANKMRPLPFNLVSTLADINKILFCTPFFGLKSQDLRIRRKKTWNSVPGVFLGVILVHLHVLGHGKPSWWGGKKFPTSPWRLWCFVCFDIKQHPQKFDEIVKNEKLLSWPH